MTIPHTTFTGHTTDEPVDAPVLDTVATAVDRDEVTVVASSFGSFCRGRDRP